MNPLDLLVSPAYAQAAGQSAPGGLFGGGLGGLLFPILLIAVMYFLMIRPQMKRQKEHRAMLEKLANGDEVITNGGVAGVIRVLGEHFITVAITYNRPLRLPNAQIAHRVPTG